MTDFNEFDRQLMEDVGELPPSEGSMNEFSPFSFAVFYIVAGLAMQTITLSFFDLQYILPMVGSVLLYLGFRTLRRENRWFMVCYVISAIRLVWQWVCTVLLATPLAAAVQGIPMEVQAALSLPVLLLYFCFRKALRAVWRRLDRFPERDPMLWAMLWYVALVVLAYVGAGTWLSLSMILWWILILRSLWKAGEDLEQVGYALRPAPVRLSKRVVGRGMLALTLIPVLFLSFWFSRPAMDWQPRTDESTADPGLRQQLLDLGFPEQVLDDLSPEDLAGYAGTLSVYDKVEVNEQDSPIEQITVYAITSESSVRVLHWFHWTRMPALRMGDAITANLPINNRESAAESAGDRYEGLTGRLLFERFGRAYTASWADLTTEEVEAQSFFGPYTYRGLSAWLAQPILGSDLRGYVVYDYHHGPDKMIDGLAFNYYHQSTPVLYPWEKPGNYLFGGPFTHYQNYTNLYTWSGWEAGGRTYMTG